MKRLKLKTLLMVGLLSLVFFGCGQKDRCFYEVGTKVVVNGRLEGVFLSGSSNCQIMFDNGAIEWFSASIVKPVN